jgi:ankyrin repeat protein
VRALLDAGADVAQAAEAGVTALKFACARHAECVRLSDDDGVSALELASEFLETVQLLCAYAPSHDAVRAHVTLTLDDFERTHECARWVEATSRWTSPLHHFEFLSIERVRALLVEGADVHAGDDEANAPTPISLAAAWLLQGADDGRAALIAAAAAPWSPGTHALFPAAAKSRAVELLRSGWQLARQVQGLGAGLIDAEVAFRDAWLGHVMPHAIERLSVSLGRSILQSD